MIDIENIDNAAKVTSFHSTSMHPITVGNDNNPRIIKNVFLKLAPSSPRMIIRLNNTIKFCVKTIKAGPLPVKSNNRKIYTGAAG